MPSSWREKPFMRPPAQDVIRGYLEAFDPDVLVTFAPKTSEVIRALGLHVITPGEIWRNLGRDAPAYGLGIFDLLNEIFREHFRYKTRYPVKLVIPVLPRQLGLFWASLIGELPAKVASAVRTNFAEALEIQFPDFEPAHLEELFGSDVLFPRRITQEGLRPERRAGFHRDASIFYMDGSKVEDVIDFWNLRATGRAVVPVPRQLEADAGLRSLVVRLLKESRRPWPHDPSVCDFASLIRSRNSTMGDLQKFAATLKIDRDPKDPSDSPFFSLQHWYPRIWDSWARGKDGAAPCDVFGTKEDSREIGDARELEARSKPLFPDFANAATYRSAPCVANEISYRAYGAPEPVAEVFPKTAGKNVTRAISGETTFRPGWRVGRNGLVKLVQDNLSESRTIPTAEAVMFAWLRDNGWAPQLSTPGLLAKQIYRRLDGHVRVLARERLLTLLEHMNGGLVRRDGSPVDRNRIDQERDLEVGEVKSRLQALSGSEDLYRFLVSKEVFTLGLKLQCPYCLRHSWVPIDNLRSTCQCPRCLQAFPAVGAVENQKWSYKTNGPFSVPNYAEGACAVLLTLETLGHWKMHSLRGSPALSFKAEVAHKEQIEADFAMLWQDFKYGELTEGVMFGECKTYGIFEATDVRRMRYLASAFPGAVIVFSTLRKALTRPEIRRIASLARAGRKYWKAQRPLNPVLILTGAELLGITGPPFCWEEATRKRYENVQGLLGICNATQQIYLDLPSWEADWRDRREAQFLRRGGFGSRTGDQPNDRSSRFPSPEST